jgi:hypothetical protein
MINGQPAAPLLGALPPSMPLAAARREPLPLPRRQYADTSRSSGPPHPPRPAAGSLQHKTRPLSPIEHRRSGSGLIPAAAAPTTAAAAQQDGAGDGAMAQQPALTVNTAAPPSSRQQQQQQQQQVAPGRRGSLEQPASARPPSSARSLLGQTSGAFSAPGTPYLLHGLLHSARHSQAAEAALPGLVVFSGGTAFNSAASALRELTTRVTHVLPVSDDGGSTAEIVRVVGGPAVGDIRSRCARWMPWPRAAPWGGGWCRG